MKVFLSWSGHLSFNIAAVLRDWLPLVIQALEPYLSSEDIDKGARWGIDIAKELEASTFGILCVTPENMEAPWLNFEAGALSKALEKSRVTPFLVEMRQAQLAAGPLIQFQATLAEKEDVWKLVKTLNDQVGDSRLDETKLRRSFEKWWPDLEGGIVAAIKDDSKASKEKPVRRDPAEASEEILELIRAQHRMITDLPAQLASRSAPTFNVESFPSRDPDRFELSALPDGNFKIIRGNSVFVVSPQTIAAIFVQEGIKKDKALSILQEVRETGEKIMFLASIRMSILRRMSNRDLERPPQSPQPPAKSSGE